MKKKLQSITVILEDILGNRLSRDYMINGNEDTEIWGKRVEDMLDTLDKSEVKEF